MSKIKWNDGITTDTSGPLRVLRLWDGYYVIGEGMQIPVEDRIEAEKLIKELKKNREG